MGKKALKLLNGLTFSGEKNATGITLVQNYMQPCRKIIPINPFKVYVSL